MRCCGCQSLGLNLLGGRHLRMLLSCPLFVVQGLQQHLCFCEAVCGTLLASAVVYVCASSWEAGWELSGLPAVAKVVNTIIATFTSWGLPFISKSLLG